MSLRKKPTAVVSLIIGFLLLLAQMRRAPETYPWGDEATTSIYVLRAVRGELATGAYSRFHWNHPGPLLYQWLVPFYALSGYREVSLKWAMLILNTSILASLLLVVRRKAPLLALAVALALLPLLYREQRVLFWSWNPMVPLLPLALVIALAAEIASTDELSGLPWLCGVGSFVVQAHVGVVPPVAAVLAVATLLRVWRWRLAPASPAGVRWVAVSAAVLAVLWAVPVAHELTTRPGNLVAIAHFFLIARADPRSVWINFSLFANQFVGPLAPGWALTTNEASASVSRPVLALAAMNFPLLAAVGIRAFRRDAAYQGAFALLCLAASAAGVLAVHLIVGPVSDYLITWIVVVGALSLAAIVVEGIDLIGVPGRVSQTAASWALATYVVAAAAIGGSRLIQKQASDSRSIIMRTLATTLAEYCQRSAIDRPLLGYSDHAWDGGTGMILQYYKNGRPLSVVDDWLYMVGGPFKATGREPAEFYLMRENESAIPPGVSRYTWLTTFGSYRLVRLFRES